MVKRKNRYINPLTGEAVTVSSQKARKDEYVDPWTGTIKRKKKGSWL